MKKIRTKFLPLLLALVTILSLLPTSAFAASKTGSGIQITQNQAYWSTRLLANGTPYSYRPPLADGKLVYCIFNVHLSILNPSRYGEYISTNRENQKSGLWAFLQYGIESYKNV